MECIPTLKGRLENALSNEIEALEQLAQSIELTPFAKKRLERLKNEALRTKSKRKKLNR